ncbi:MAG: carboxypeptidase regulatory-like domain-containing protein, partial [Salinibacter sp.]
VYVSRVGYTPERIDVVLPPDTTLSLMVRLEPTVIRADPVTVSGRRGEKWHEYLRRFKRLFVGVSPRARRCYLRNPNVLQFDAAWWGRFEADASRPLKFENRALGYRVTYYLKNFEERGDIVRWDGEPLFTPLSPRDSAEAARWAKNRRRAFYGSLRHFLLALLHDRVKEEQFRMYHLPRADAFRNWRRARRRPISRSDLLTTQGDSLHEISFSGTLEVQYTGAGETDAYVEWADLHRAPRDKQVSLIRLNKRSIHVDRHGEIVEPYGATLYRYFAFRQRLANLLPREYRPDGTSLRAVGPSQ